MRLIDADDLLSVIVKMSFDFGNDTDDTETIIEMVNEVIANQPTAYDIDKVVAELGKPYNNTVMAGKHFTTVDKAIGIVRRGGME